MGVVLAGKVAIVTGASSGIGQATATLFAAEGARVVAGARRQAPLDALVDDIMASGGEAVALAGDVRDETFARALVETAVERFGGLDVAFNNAGTVGQMGATPEITREAWQETIDTNASSFTTGTALLVDGGVSINRT